MGLRTEHQLREFIKENILVTAMDGCLKRMKRVICRNASGDAA